MGLWRCSHVLVFWLLHRLGRAIGSQDLRAISSPVAGAVSLAFSERFDMNKAIQRGLVAAGVLVAGSAAHAAGSPMDDIFAAVSFAGVATFVGVAGVAIVGIALAMKGISLAKRAISKA